MVAAVFSSSPRKRRPAACFGGGEKGGDALLFFFTLGCIFGRGRQRGNRVEGIGASSRFGFRGGIF